MRRIPGLGVVAVAAVVLVAAGCGGAAGSPTTTSRATRPPALGARPLAYAGWAASTSAQFATRFSPLAPLSLENFRKAWNAAPFAASYTLEVYKNNDNTFSSSTRFISVTV